MATFSYTGKQVDGTNVSGTIEAPNRREAVEMLRARNCWVTHIRRVRGGLSIPLWQIFVYRANPGALALFFESLYHSLRAGMTIREALDVIRESGEHRFLRRAAGEMAESVGQGIPLSSLLAQRPTLFPPICMSMARVGEEAGSMEKMLYHCAQHFRQIHEINQMVKARTIYFWLMLALVVLIIIGGNVAIWYVVTHVSGVSEETYPIALLKDILGSIRTTILRLIVVGAAAFLAWRILPHIRGFRYIFDRVKLSLPFISKVAQRLTFSRFGRAFANLVSAGIAPGTALSMSADACGNEVIAGQIKSAVSAIQSGERLSVALSRAVNLPGQIRQVIVTGERTGTLDQTLLRAADLFDREAETGINAMVWVLYIALLLAWASAMGYVVINFFARFYGGILQMVD